MKVIIFLLLVTSVLCNGQDLTCDTRYDSNNQTMMGMFRNYTILSNNDTRIIQALSPLSLISSFLVILFYYKFPATREQPGDVILAVAVSQIFLIIGFISTVVYNSHYPLPQDGSFSIPQGFNTFCSITGYLIVLPFCAQFVYNISFCAFFIVIVNNVFKSWQKEKWIVHAVCLITIVIIAVILLLTDQIGISLFGVCGLKLSKYSPFLRCALIILYAIGLGISTIYFRKKIPDFQADQVNRKIFTKYNFRYIVAILINLILQTSCDLIAAISCQTRSVTSSIVDVSVTMSNTFSIVTPILICFVMITHPQVKNGLYSFLISCFGERRKKKDRQMILTQNGYVERQLEMQQTKEIGLLANVLSITKSRLIYTILCAIVVQDRQVSGLDNLNQINQWNYKDKMIIKMDQNILKQFGEITLDKMSALNVSITSYCPRIFKTLMKRDGFANITTFLNPKANKESIEKLSQGSGGRSGQFFFFSYDNQIIIKTLSKKQLDVLLGRLQAFVKHYDANPNSLITKIYGVYSLSSNETGQQYHLFIMKNLSACDRKFITKTYDLKGSRLDRKVLKDYESVDQTVNKTMKDIDFQQIEGKLFIDKEQSDCLKQILTKDSIFLKENKLIDYSLIVMKMNLKQYLQEKQMLLQQFRTKMINPYAIIQSTKEVGIAYVIGIIDFLETWTTKKKSERLTKVLLFFKFQNTQDVSAQAPELYSTRFIQKVVNIL